MILDKRHCSLLKTSLFEYLPVLLGLDVESFSFDGLRFREDLKFLRISLLLFDFPLSRESYLVPKKLLLFFCYLAPDFSMSLSVSPKTHLKNSFKRSFVD